jgi:hypothetical protein
MARAWVPHGLRPCTSPVCGLRVRGKAHHGLKRLIGTGPVLAQKLLPSGAQRVPVCQGGDENIIELAGNRDEVRDDVDRN